VKYYKLKFISIFVLFLSFFITENVFSQNTNAFDEISYLVRNFGVGIRTLSMGGAGIGNVKDYSAIYWNPAGLAFAESPEIFGSFSNIVMNNDAIFMNNLTSGRQSFTKFNSIGFMYPLSVYRGGLTFAFGYNRVMDYNSILSVNGFNNNPDDNVYQSEDVTEEGGLNNLSFSGAIISARGLSFGATLSYIHGKHLFNTFFKEFDNLNLYTMDNYTEIRYIESKIKGFDLKVGMQYVINPYFSIGTVISFPQVFFIEDEFEVSAKTFYDSDLNKNPESFYDTGFFEYKVSTPFAFGFGASFNSSGFVVSGDVEYRDLSQIRYLTDTPLEGLSRGEANNQIRKTIEPILTKRIGIELPFFEKSVKLRSGYFEVPNPIKFSMSENTRKYITAGIGINPDKNIELNIAYMRGWWKDSSFDDLITIPVKEDRVETKFYAGILFKF
jgi:long-subunit fatty acid transport protein